MKKNPLFLDLETFSEIDIMSAGAHKYAEDCRIDLCSWAIGPKMPVEMWDATCEPIPKILKQELENPERIKVAHNSNFDRNVLNHQLIKTEVEEWEDTMVIAYTLALPGRLDHMLVSLGADQDYRKISDGKRLVRMFCKPQKVTTNQPFRIRDSLTDPDDWNNYLEYARQDTNSMRWAYYNMPQWVIGRNGRESAQHELDLWHLSERINDRGLPIDIKLAEEAIKLTDIALERLNKELYKLTSGAADAHSKRDQVLKWIASQGVSMKGYTKENLIDALKLDLPPKVKRVLEIRQEAGRTSTAKYQALLDGVCKDGRLRGGIQYYGAKRTGRYAGRKFQPHNLPHPEVKDTDTAAEAIIQGTTDLLYEESAMALAVSCVRSSIKAPEGKALGVTDLSNIEGRVLPWLAGEAWKLKAFADYDNGIGADIYKLAYHKSFGTPVEDIDKEQRQIGKFQELSLGYQGGVGAFYKQAKKFETDMDALYLQVEDKITEVMMESALWMVSWIRKNRKDLDEVSDNGIIGADVIKQMWRAAHPKICSYWYTLESMVRYAIENQEAGQVFTAGIIKASVRDDKLMIMLPSKRPLIYNHPKIKRIPTVKKVADGKGSFEEITVYEEKIIYMNHDKGAWRTTNLYGGKIAENVTQAVARDVLTYNMPAIDKEYPIIGTVHDETISEIEEIQVHGCDRYGNEVQKDLNNMLSINPPWATGLPLNADGYISQRYKKD